MAIREVDAAGVEQGEFMMAEHAEAALEVCQRHKYIITCRKTGQDSIGRLRDGNPAKGHDILSKSLKPKSLKDLVKDEGLRAELTEKLRPFFGLVAYWEKSGDSEIPTGVLAVDREGTELRHGGLLLPFDAMSEADISRGYTGDYDLHDILQGGSGAGRRLGAPVASESPEQWDAIRKLNARMLAVDSRRMEQAESWGNLQGFAAKNWENPYAPLRHGPQRNYWAYALADVHEEDIVMAVVGYDKPIAALHSNGKAYILEEIDDIKSFYRQNGGYAANIWDISAPEAWEKYGRWLYYRWQKERSAGMTRMAFASKLLAWRDVALANDLKGVVNNVMGQSSSGNMPTGGATGLDWMKKQYAALRGQLSRG